MLCHRVERHKERLRVTLDLDLSEAVAGLDPDSGYREELERYCTTHVISDVLEVAHILVQEDSQLGTVRWFSEARGYGFIRAYDGRDIFVHHSGIVGDGFKTLQQGQKVRFKCRVGQQLSAFDVTLADRASERAPVVSESPDSSQP